MFRIIRYIIILVLIMLGLFFLEKNNSWFEDKMEYVKIFFSTIGDTNTNNIVNDIENSIKTATTTTVKSDVQDNTKNPKPADISKTEAKISIDGIIYYTNLERTKAGLKPLVKNTKLNESAIDKIDDMFANQYFEHTSLDGKTVSDLVKVQDYKFQIVGENLALGVFSTDKALVQAWMDSPTHRQNILNPKYTEMGAAVGIGDYKKQKQWMAVQHFAKPLPMCPEVDEVSKQNIDAEKNALELEKIDLQKMAGNIESDLFMNNSQYIAEYNIKVGAYNDRLNKLRDVINDYNQTIIDYNTCLKK